MTQRLTALLVTFCLGLALAACGPAGGDGDAGFASDRMSITVTGTGPPVILIPGLASDDAVWDGLVSRLEGDYTLYAVQIHGFAGAPAGGNADAEDLIDNWADEIRAYAEGLGEPPVLVGHSLGGLVAMKAALEDPAAIDRLAVIDVLPFFSVLIDDEATPESIAPMAAVARATLLAQSDAVFEQRQGEAITTLVKTHSLRPMVLEWSLASDRAVMAEAMAEAMTTDLRPHMADIAVPMLVIYARDDAIDQMERVEKLYLEGYSAVPDVRLAPIENAFHFVMLDQEAATAEALRGFLSGD